MSQRQQRPVNQNTPSALEPNLRVGMVEVVLFVIDAGTVTTTEVADAFGVSNQHATGVLNRLETARYVNLIDKGRQPYLWAANPLRPKTDPSDTER